MADIINNSLTFNADKNGAKIEFANSFKLVQAGDEFLSTTQVIGTSAETLNLGDITGAPGAVVIKNLDATNFVEIGGDSGLTVFKLKILPGQHAAFQPTSATIYAEADTADVRIQILATEA